MTLSAREEYRKLDDSIDTKRGLAHDPVTQVAALAEWAASRTEPFHRKPPSKLIG